jgi:hypothetical protein
LIRKTDSRGRVTLPKDFVSCIVTLERAGDVVRIRKAQSVLARRYSFKQLIAGVTKRNLHEPINTGRPLGAEAL